MFYITIQVIRKLCASNPAIIAAYLFGSAAKKADKPACDIDIALFLAPDQADAFDFLSFSTHLEKDIGRRVDLVVLNRAGEVLKYQVRKFGRLLFERDSKQRKRFEVLGRKHYEDFLHLHRRYTGKTLYGEKSID